MTDYARLVVSVDSTQVKKGDQALGDFEKSAKRTEKSVSSLGSVVRSVAAPLAAFLSVRAVIRASDEYGQMASRIRNATSSTEEYEMVQARLLETANGTYRALSEAQEVYLSTADTLRDLGYATSEVLDITDSFSYALVRDAARADQARTAMDAYSKALMKGKIDADGFASILAATPSIVNGIAEATGRSTEEIRKLGATGKLSVEALNEGLRRSRDENKALADAMETSVQDALVNLQTQFGVFVGKVNETSGASGVLVESIGDLADILADPATVEAAQQLAAGIVTALGVIASAARETVGAVRWMSEELAVAFGGIGLQDIERLEAEASRLQQLLNTMESRGETGYAIYGSTKQSYDKIKAQLDQAYELADLAKSVGGSQGSIEPAKALAENRKLVSAIAADTKEADAEAKKLTNSYQSMEKSLARQLALYGQTSEVASLRFEIEQGALKGIAGQQAEYLIGLARELDAKRDLTEQEKIRIDILRESGQLRAANDAQFQLEYAEKIAEYERQGNVEALQRLETLRRIREVQMNADQAPGTVEGVSQAPDSGGVDAVVGGPAGELIKLQEQAVALDEWRATELEKQRGFLEAKAITEEEYATRIANIHAQHQQEVSEIEAARQQVALAGAADLFGNLAGLTAQFAGEQSSLYKAMFVAQKAFAIAQSMIAIQQGIALAAANPWPLNLGAMASVAAATAGLVSNIAAVGMSFDGGGYTGNGPRSGGLDGKGGFLAMMHPQETVIDHTKPGGNSGSGGGVMVNVNLVEDASRAGTVEKSQNPDGSWDVTAFVADLHGDGPAAKAISQYFGIQKVGR